MCKARAHEARGGVVKSVPITSAATLAVIGLRVVSSGVSVVPNPSRDLLQAHNLVTVSQNVGQHLQCFIALVHLQPRCNNIRACEMRRHTKA